MDCSANELAGGDDGRRCQADGRGGRTEGVESAKPGGGIGAHSGGGGGGGGGGAPAEDAPAR